MCRLCGAPLSTTFADLGYSPLANSYNAGIGPQVVYPLHAYVCDRCFLVQLRDEDTPVPADIFSEYSYFTSYSQTALDHAHDFARESIERLKLNSESRVIEIASNDGYMLRWFRDRGIPTLGIEPAHNVAQVAIDAGIPTRCEFFTKKMAQGLAHRGVQADLLIANNVLAHVPDLHDFVAGLKLILKPGGALCIEVPHLLPMFRHEAFDQIYHEHLSYFSMATLGKLLLWNGLNPSEVIPIDTHGGSLRILATHCGADPDARVKTLDEDQGGLYRLDNYTDFAKRVPIVKRDIVRWLIGLKDNGVRSIVGYGAPAKATTLFNYCGIDSDIIDYVVDRSPHKIGRYVPGTRIPIMPVEHLKETQPEHILILPWNLREEITTQLEYTRAWGAKLFTAYD